jgi:hypothetical protein
MIKNTNNGDTDMSKTRTDVHSEAHLAPEDYRYYSAYDSRPDYPMCEGALEIKRVLIAELLDRNGSVHPIGQCAHCGHHLRHIVIFTHVPTGDLVAIGQDCAFTRMGLSDRQFKGYMRRVNAARKIAKAEGKGAAWRKANPMIVNFFASPEWTDWKFYCKSFLVSLSYDLKNLGALTDNQTDAAIKAITNGRVHEAKATQRDAERDADKAAAADCPEGRVTVTGEIIKLDSKPGFAYNTTRWVMTVKDDGGFLVWGTVPSALMECDKGDRVTFSAAVSPSDSDPKFGFYKKPTKAEALTGRCTQDVNTQDEDDRSFAADPMGEGDDYRDPWASTPGTENSRQNDADASEYGLSRSA